MSFVEYPYLPGVHTFFGPMQRLRAKKADSGSTGKGQGTPLYVAADGKILDDSWESLEVLGPVPEEMKKARRVRSEVPGFEEIDKIWWNLMELMQESRLSI